MSSTSARDRKRKPDEVMSSSNNNNSDDQSNSRARRVSTDAQAATTGIAFDEKNKDDPTANAESKFSIENIGQMIQDLFHSDYAKVNDALDTLMVDLDEDKTKWENIQAVGGCHALVQLMNKCFNKWTNIIPPRALNKITAAGDLPELEIIDKSLQIIRALTNHLGGRTVASIGGVEAVVEAMETFSDCLEMQNTACCVLNNLLSCSIGQKKALEMNAMVVILDTLEGHREVCTVCTNACFTLHIMVAASKENTERFIDSGGLTTVAGIRKHWQHDDTSPVHEAVRKLMEPVVKELSCWAQAK
jgi:hypothetical protein